MGWHDGGDGLSVLSDTKKETQADEEKSWTDGEATEDAGDTRQRKSERGKGESIFSGYTLLLTASGDIEPRAREREQPVK